jgi:hypothetical protein
VSEREREKRLIQIGQGSQICERAAESDLNQVRTRDTRDTNSIITEHASSAGPSPNIFCFINTSNGILYFIVGLSKNKNRARRFALPKRPRFGARVNQIREAA